MYGQPLPIHFPYFLGVTSADSVNRSLVARAIAVHPLRHNLHKTHNRMKQQGDKHAIEREFNVSNLVYVKLQPYKQRSTLTIARNCLLNTLVHFLSQQ